MRVLDPTKLEDVLVKTWSHFIDKSRLIAFVLRCVRDHGDITELDEKPPVQGMQFSISRFVLHRGGYEVSIEYACPANGGITVGTCEALLKWDGELEHVWTVGVLFRG